MRLPAGMTLKLCFVYDEETDLAADDVLEKVTVLEAFRREIEDFTLPLADHAMRLADLRRVQVRVHGDGVHAVQE